MTIPSDDQLLGFGRVVYNYATVESGIKIALSAILQIGLGDALITFQPYGALNLKNVAKSLAKERLRPELVAPFCCIVGDWAAFGYLRNAIAHSRWTPGSRPDSIKPRSVDIREGKALWSGDMDTEADYTAKDLKDKADQLDKINERLKAFIQTSGLLPVVAEMMELTSAAISLSAGSDGSSAAK